MNWHNSIFWRSLRLAALVVGMTMAAMSIFAIPPTKSPQETLFSYLQTEKAALVSATKSQYALHMPATLEETDRLLNEHHANLLLIRAKILSLQNMSEQLGATSESNKQQNNVNGLMNETLILAKKYEFSLVEAERQLKSWQAKQQGELRLVTLDKKIEFLSQARNKWMENNVKIQTNLVTAKPQSRYVNEVKLQLNNHRIHLINLEIKLINLKIDLIKTEDSLLKNKDIKTIFSVIDTYKDALLQTANMQKSVRIMQEFLKEQNNIVESATIKQEIKDLINQATQFQEKLIQYTLKLAAILEEKQQELKKQISIRQGLSMSQLKHWSILKNELTQAVNKTGNYLKLITELVTSALSLMTWSYLILFSLGVSFILGIAIILRMQLMRWSYKLARSHLTMRLIHIMISIFAFNIPFIAFIGSVILFFEWLSAPREDIQLIINILLVALIFKNLIFIAKSFLYDGIANPLVRDQNLYYRFKFLFIFGGLVSILLITSQDLMFSLLIQALMARIYMLFIFTVAIILWSSRDSIQLILKPILSHKKRYIRQAISLLLILLPFTLLTTALIGLVGYMNLAWSMSRYQAYVVVVIISYVLARGLLVELMQATAHFMISNLHNGWLWTEAILKPMDQLIQLLLLIGSGLLLFELFDVYTDTSLVAYLHRIGQYSIVNISGIHITLASVLAFLIVMFVFVWAAKWTRELSYRWIYRNAKDEGVRHSLSVFTQYLIILIGVYTTLRVLGLDFSGMSMILGGLAVGMGFGLRDFASNIVGGIMLLIERPVREGDLITIGEHEGRVSHIGIRSMRVSSWDNTEVLIPNAETFNKPFINWTHQDNIVRTIVPIKISRKDDPLRVQKLISEVLDSIPEVLSEPMFEVFLKQIDEALIEFEVRYYMNIVLNSRFEVRSKVLFSILERFKLAGIEAPVEPMSVVISEPRA